MTNRAKAQGTMGPLTVHPTNPRYFTDGTGKAIYLTGSHTKQHPVGMTGAPIDNATLLASPADWIAPTGADGYNTDPPAADGRKVIFSDVDHVWPKDFARWPWKSFTRGLNTAFMDLYGATRIGDKEVTALTFCGDWLTNHDVARRRLGHTRVLAARIDLAAMTPREDLSNTGYCLAAPGREYVVYQPGTGAFRVTLEGASAFAVEWIDADTGTVTAGESVKGMAEVTLEPPFTVDAVLHLRRQP